MLITPTPSNIRIAHTKKQQAMVDSDLYNIAERVKEIDPRLIIIFHDREEYPFVVMEQCADGETRYVKRYQELDSRILDDLRHMLSVPFMDRVRVADELEAKRRRELEAPDPEVIEWLAHEMRRELIKSNWIDPVNTTHYALKKRKG
jgi:hypothetical protein